MNLPEESAGATDAVRREGCFIAENARCLPVPLGVASTFAVNAENIPVMT